MSEIKAQIDELYKEYNQGFITERELANQILALITPHI